MKTIELVGNVDDQHSLRAQVPDDVPPGNVKLVLLLPDGGDDVGKDEWMRFIAENWKDELSDPREDVYTLEDGEPVK